MTKPMQISLKAGERIYINGAVVRVDRKVSIELMNDVAFMLESHVMQAEETTTPLRQLYFVLQTLLMAPGQAETVLSLFHELHTSTAASFTNKDVLADLATVARLVDADRIFEALKTIRGLFATEDMILNSVPPAKPSRAA